MREFYEKYKWRIIFSALALTVALLIINIGFFRTLLVLILVGIGFLIGQWRDNGIDPLEFLNSIFGRH